MRMCGERHSRARDLRKSNISTVRCARAFMHPVSHVAKDYLLILSVANGAVTTTLTAHPIGRRILARTAERFILSANLSSVCW